MTPVKQSTRPRAEQLAARLKRKTARVAVVGLGYVGLPLAETFAWGGYPVIGFDIDADKVENLRNGQSYIGHIDPERVAELNASGRFEPTDDPTLFATADAIVICVPTPLTEAREPDLTYVVNSAKAVAARLRPGRICSIEDRGASSETECHLEKVVILSDI